jgi:GNAT superfamily N-acetyltransferase
MCVMPTLRTATHADIPALHRLIEASIRGLQASDYTPAQIEGAIGNALGLDTQLVADGTYFLVEAPKANHPIACGGWSFRRTLFGDPAYARRGLGTLILTHAEQAATAAGFRTFEMGSTLTGVPLYTLRGYTPVERVAIPLPNGETLPIVKMTKAPR